MYQNVRLDELKHKPIFKLHKIGKISFLHIITSLSNILLIQYYDDYYVVKTRYNQKTFNDINFLVIRFEDFMNLTYQDCVDIAKTNQNIILKFDMASKLLLGVDKLKNLLEDE